MIVLFENSRDTKITRFMIMKKTKNTNDKNNGKKNTSIIEGIKYAFSS